MPRQPKYKDWKPGECRVKCELVTETGARISMYIPHLHPKDGAAFNALMIETGICTQIKERPARLSDAILRAWARIVKKRKAEQKEAA